MSSLAISDLVNRAVMGDQEAMLQIVERYKQRVFGLCFRMLGQREEAEDMSQESFLRVLSNLHRWDHSRAFEPWLLTIVANRCRTHLSRRKQPAPSLEQTAPPEDLTWTEDHNAQHLLEEVRLVLALLPRNHRRAFELFHHQQLSYADISSLLNIPEGTAKTWVHRARTELARRLSDREVLEFRHAM